jgi:hypothetical protein
MPLAEATLDNMQATPKNTYTITKEHNIERFFSPKQ